MVVCFLSACGDYELNLPGGYVLFSESPNNQIIMREEGRDPHEPYVPCNVTGYDYNDEFIVAKQQARIECYMDKDNAFDPYDLKDGEIYYWIIDAKQKRVNGPYTEQEYRDNRIKLEVSDNLSVTNHS